MRIQNGLSVDDLQEILCVLNVAVVLLDGQGEVRLITPSMRSILGGETGRAMSLFADFKAWVAGTNLQEDIHAMTLHRAPVNRRIEGPGQLSYNRRVMPFGDEAGEFAGTIIVFSDAIACGPSVYAPPLSDVAERGVAATRLVATLTLRQREVMDRVLAGQPSKNIAADLGISRRTVETHRAVVMRKTRSASIPALARMALAASGVAGAA